MHQTSETSQADVASPKVIGHLIIKDYDTKQVLIDTRNAINFEVMSLVIALSLSARPSGTIQQLVFGNGSSSISAVGHVVYLTPNVTGLDAQLYHQTYAKFINELSPLDTNPTSNYIRVNHIAGMTYSDIVVTCVLDYNEPSDQAAFDDASNITDAYVFDEIGLKTYDPATQKGYLLSHVIFHPVQKSLNRRIEIFYTLRILMV